MRVEFRVLWTKPQSHLAVFFIIKKWRRFPFFWLNVLSNKVSRRLSFAFIDEQWFKDYERIAP